MVLVTPQMVYMTPYLKELTGTLPLSKTYPLNSDLSHG